MNAPATSPTTGSTSNAPSSAIDGAFEAIASPVRRSILDALRDGDRRTVSEIADQCDDLSRSTISRHLRVLRDAELVHAERDGRSWDYAIRTEPLDEIYRAWLVQYVRRQDALDVESERIDGPAGTDASETDAADAGTGDDDPSGARSPVDEFAFAAASPPRSPEDIVERISRRLGDIPTAPRSPTPGQRAASAPAKPAWGAVRRPADRYERSGR